MDEPLAGVRAFRIRDPASAMSLLDEARGQVAPLGAFVVLSDNLYEMSVPYLVLMPTTDYREAVIAFGTPVGQDTDCYELVAWLEKLEESQPFVLTHLGPDLIRARFTTPVRDSGSLVKAIQKICPDASDANLESYAKHLQESRQLFLWWD
jgi:hypothetical protein